MEVNANAHPFRDLLGYRLDFVSTVVARSKQAAKAKHISKRVALIFVYAKAIGQACKLAKRVAKIMLSCLNVSRVKKVEGTGRIFERKFCQLCPLEIARPVDYHHAVSIL